MADFDSSLPIKTLAAGDIDIFLSDATISTQKLKVNADGSIDTNISATDLDIRDLLFASDKVDVSGSAVTVSSTDLDIRDLTAVSDSVQANLFDEAGVAYSSANPLPVELTSDQAGDEICEYNTSASVAKDASVNHDYTVTAAKTLLLGNIWATGSGKIKVEVLSDSAVIFVAFNSTANPNVSIPIEKFCKTAAAAVVRVTITNLDNQAQDVYSTLTGIEV